MRTLSQAAATILLSGAATAGGLHWSVDAPTTAGNGFVAYGVLHVNDGYNGAAAAGAEANFVDFFLSPFAVDGGVVDFGVSLPHNAAEVGPDSSAAGVMSQQVTIDGDGGASVRVVASSAGATTHTGLSPFSSSSDPNNRAVASLSFENADPTLPVRVRIEWTSSMGSLAAPGVTTDGQLGHQLGLRRGGEVIYLTTVNEGIDLADGPLEAAGERLVVIAPGDNRTLDFTVRTFGIADFAGAGGVEINGTAGEFSSVFAATFHLRQFCPGDADGDDRVNFADLNLVVGSFNATGEVGEHAGDINGDGRVDFADLNMVLNNFGQVGC